MHYGKFVAEAKFLEQREEYSRLIRQHDSDGIMALLTNEAVEKQVQDTNNFPPDLPLASIVFHEMSKTDYGCRKHCGFNLDYS